MSQPGETRYVCPHNRTSTQDCFECDLTDNVHPNGWRHVPVECVDFGGGDQAVWDFLDGVGTVCCDPTKPNSSSPAPHDYVTIDQEYGSLADGGSYDVLRCVSCGRIAYSQLPD